MRRVHFVDTSVLLNLLDVPKRNADAKKIKTEMETIIQNKETIILPVASIIETGNHIAHISDGGIRRKVGQKYIEFLRATADGRAPWKLSTLVWDANTLRMLADYFCEFVIGEVGVGDLSIISEYNQYCDMVPGVSVRIWSLDHHLQSYEYKAPKIGI